MTMKGFRSASPRLIFPLFCLLIAADAFAGPPQDGNSTRKIRVTPGPIAAKIGSAVQWVDSFDEARALSKKTGKSIFWYVPTLSGSFMDRKDSIDRYMMAGPFSWESTRNYLNQNYVCLKSTGSGELQKRFQLVPYDFVEPGFVVIDVNGNVTRRVDKITTLHPQWFLKLIGGEPMEIGDSKAWREFRQGNYKIEPEPFDNADDSAEAIRERLLAGMLEFRRGNHDRATAIWRKLANDHPAHPLAWKAAAEAEGFGPFVRGFEVHRKIPAASLNAGVESEGSAAPKATFNEEQLIKRGVDFLLGMQRKDGAWVDCDYDFGGTDSLPNVHVAITSLAGMALLAAAKKIPEKQQQIADAVRRAANFVAQDGNINRVDRDELFWAHAYRTRFLARMAAGNDDIKTAFLTAARDLENIQGKRGGWYHEYNNPFVTGTALCALFEARQAGFEVDMNKIKKGIESLRRDRLDNGAYPYYSSRGNGKKRAGTDRQIVASAGRMPICELALNYWGAVDQPSLIKAIKNVNGKSQAPRRGAEVRRSHVKHGIWRFLLLVRHARQE